MRLSWVNCRCRGVLFVWIRVGQGSIALAVGAGGCCLDIFTLIYRFSSLSPSLWETTRYRLKYCLKGSLSPKTTNQPMYVWVDANEQNAQKNVNPYIFTHEVSGNIRKKWIYLFHIVSAHACIGHVTHYFPIIGETLHRWGKRILNH